VRRQAAVAMRIGEAGTIVGAALLVTSVEASTQTPQASIPLCAQPQRTSSIRAAAR